MPVDKDFSLDAPDGITEADIAKLNADADELVEKTKSNEETDKRVQTDGNVAGMTMEELVELIGDILEEQAKAKKERKKNAESIDENKKALTEFQKTKAEINRGVGEIQGFLGSPVGFGKNKALGFLGKAGLYGAIAQFVIEQVESLYNQIYQEIKNQFKPGGVWDRRKLVEDVVEEYNSISYLTKVKSGTVFFSGDAGQDIRQGAPRGAYNTRDLRDGHQRFQLLNFNE